MLKTKEDSEDGGVPRDWLPDLVELLPASTTENDHTRYVRMTANKKVKMPLTSFHQPLSIEIEG